MIRAVLIRLFVVSASQVVLHCADRPTWTLDTQALGVPSVWIDRSARAESRYSAIRLQFNQADEVTISFLQRRTQGDLAERDRPANSSTALELLLVSKTDGSLIGRSSWPVLGETDALTQITSGSRVEPLGSGGYLGIINGHLQVLDPSLKVLHERKLDRPREGRIYDLLAPLSGPFFALVESFNKFTESVEVIDSRTLSTAERWEVPGVGVEDVREECLLAIRADGAQPRVSSPLTEVLYPGYEIIEKRIGGSWRDLGLKLKQGSQSRFTNDGEIAATGHAPGTDSCCDCWSIIGGRDKSDPPVCYSSNDRIRSITPARQAPVMAVGIYKWGGLRAVFDMNGLSWVVVQDLKTRQRLLTTPVREGMIGYALSPDGRFLAVLTKKRLEMYAVRRS